VTFFRVNQSDLLKEFLHVKEIFKLLFVELSTYLIHLRTQNGFTNITADICISLI